MYNLRHMPSVIIIQKEQFQIWAYVIKEYSGNNPVVVAEQMHLFDF